VARPQQQSYDNTFMTRFLRLDNIQGRIFWVALALTMSLMGWLLLRHFSPSPPRSIAMTTGAPDGAYHLFATKYQTILAESGVHLELMPSSGSIENLDRIKDGKAAVGLVQGGLGVLTLDPRKDEPDTNLRSLATVGFEPVWIFSRKIDLSLGLNNLAGQRVGIGLPNSGTEKVAKELLRVFGLTDTNGLPLQGIQMFPESGVSAAGRLQRGELDAVIFVAAPQAAAVSMLMNDPSIELASLRLVDGLTRRLPHFQSVVLKQGSVNPQRNFPAQDIVLIATLANLVVRDDIHPALAYLLLEAAHKTHNHPSLLSRPNDFPSPIGVDFPLADDADRYFKNGRPFLQRYLPFWLANFVQRLLLVLIPLLAILLPLLKLLPAVLAWKHEQAILQHYGELVSIEQTLQAAHDNGIPLSEALLLLDTLEQKVSSANFPTDVRDRAYVLRQHIQWVRERFHHPEVSHAA
jgi:TRAP transporter TAXI family solute receptor